MASEKKLTLKESAREIFADKGYKATSISEIAKQARMAVGSFYKYYESKEDIFLDVYIDENNIIRQTMIDNIDWDGDMVELISQIFGWSRSLISSNKTLIFLRNYITIIHQKKVSTQIHFICFW